MRTDRHLAHREPPMRLRRRHRGLPWGAAALLVLGTPGSAWCQEQPGSEIDRWVPAFAVTSDILVQGAEGSLQNSLRPPEAPNTRFSSNGSFTEPAVGGSLELMSPALLAMPGRPRLFTHGGFSAVFSSDVDLAKEGSPGDFEPPPPLGQPPPEAWGGQGSKTSGEIDTLLITAGVGIAFTFDLAERRFRLKPSFEYVRERVTVEGLVQTVEGPNGGPFDLIVLDASGSDTFHGIGGGLELEMDTVRFGPFMLSLFLDGKATRMLGNRKVELASSAPAGNASWDAEFDPWLYRGGLGLRFRYVPERWRQGPDL